MKRPRRSFLRSAFSKLRQAWRGSPRAYDQREQQRLRRIEFLEPRQMLNADPPYDPNTDFHIHYELDLLVNGQQVVIPKGVGNNLGAESGKIHTHDFTGKIHVHPGPRSTFVTLGEFFDAWKNDTAVGNANSVLTSTNLLNNVADGSHVVRMYVNGTLSTDFAHDKIHDDDQIVISYESTTSENDPSFNTIANQTLSTGAPLWLPLDGIDPNGGPLTYEVEVANPGLVTATVPTGNRSIRMDVTDFGVMTFQLFDNLGEGTPGPRRVTDRIVQLIESQFYDRKSDTERITFHRVIDGFVIQAGDPTGTGGGGSLLGDFDDQFHQRLQHTSSGLLSMAKSGDDTNDSQFFVTDVPTRFLDFNHSIFGRLTDGDEVRDAINSVATDDGDRPLTPVVINTMSVVNDTENGVLQLRANAGASGTTNVTVRVRDAQGNTYQQVFQVTVQADTTDTQPFLNDIPVVNAASGQATTFQLTAQDVENGAVTFNANKPNGTTVAYTLSVNKATGQVTVTPPAGFTGSFTVNVRAYDNPQNDAQIDAFASQFGFTDPTDPAIRQRLINETNQATRAQLQTFLNLVAQRDQRTDLQAVTVNVGGAAPTLDLAAGSDTGVSNTDNITNDGTVDFTVTGLTSGATVTLKKGSTVLTTGSVTGTSHTFSNFQLSTLGEGTHGLTVTQTVSGTESLPSTVVDVTYDVTAPGAFTSTAPTKAQSGVALSYDAQTADESTSGVRYSLTNAPAGATIAPTTGVLSWTPTAAQAGTRTFDIVASDLAGNTRPQAASIVVSVPKADVSLTVTKPDGTALTSLGLNEEFILHVFSQDIRDNPRGVFAAFVDITWDAARAETVGQIQFGSSYPNTRLGSVAAGSIDEAGAVAGGSDLGSGKVEVFSIRMRAKTAGNLVFTADPADVTPQNDVLVIGENVAVPDDAVILGAVSVTVAATFTAVNDTVTNINEDSTNNSLLPLANDTSIGGATNVLTISAVGTTSSGGVVTIAGDGKSLIYRPAGNFAGTESFTYTARNQNNETATATMTVTVQNVNDSPQVVNDALSATRGSSNNIFRVLDNDLIAPDTNETLRITEVGTGSAGGTITIGPGGADIRYTPVASFSGTESFSYTISDRASGGLTAQGVVTVTVSGVRASADNFTVEEDTTTPTNLNVLANDATDPQFGGTLTITAIGNRSNGGTVTIASDGKSLNYTPAANFQGNETFTYTINDGQNHTAIGTVTVTVTNVNDAPSAVNDTVTGFKNTPTTFDVLANDTSAPDPLENLLIDSVVQPSNGTVTIIENGKKLSFTPSNNFTGTTSFTYIIKDPTGATSTAATVTVNVQEFVPSSLSGFAYFDVDNDGQKDDAEMGLAGVTVTLTGTTTSSQSVNQTVKTKADGSYKFENLAPGNYSLTQTQTALTIDGRDSAGSQGGTTNTNDRILISNMAQGTTGTNNNFGERGRAVATISLRDLFSSNSSAASLVALDANGNQLWHSLSGSDWQGFTNGTFSLQNNNLRLEATNPQAKTVATTVSATSDKVSLIGQSSGVRLFRIYGGPSNFAFSPVTPTDPNTPNSGSPTAVTDSFTTAEDTPLIRSAPGLLSNDTDPQSNTLTASAVTQPSNGTLTLAPNGSFTYTPSLNFNGTDSFSYRAFDGTNNSAPAVVTITVTGVNDVPTTVAETFSTGEDNALTVPAASGVLTNDSDPEGSSLTAALAANAANGNVSLGSNGGFTYTPRPNFFGTDSFSYRASDSVGQSAPRVVTITVTGSNDAPLAGNDSLFTNQDTALTVATPGVMGNDADPDQNPLVVARLTDPGNGQLTFNADGSLTYTPNTGFSGLDSFTYRLTDGTLNSDAVVTIAVNPSSNTPPVGVTDSFTVTEDTPFTSSATGVLQNDTDTEQNTLTAALVTNAANGTVTLSAGGSFTYTPNANFSGTDSFTYRARDATAQSNLTTVTLTVTAVNDAPTAGDDSHNVNEDITLTVAAPGLLSNDGDVDNTSLTAAVASNPGHGTLTLNGNGSFTYIPTPNFSGVDSFTYTVSDGTLTDTGTVTITVAEVAGEGEGEGEGESALAAADAGLMAYLADAGEEADSWSDLELEDSDEWEAAVDEVLAGEL